MALAQILRYHVQMTLVFISMFLLGLYTIRP
jgi:hypothetical protein